MKILPIHKELENYLKKRRLLKKFEKQKELFENNPFHRSLNTEVLEPRHLRLWSFRLDKLDTKITLINKGISSKGTICVFLSIL